MVLDQYVKRACIVYNWCKIYNLFEPTGVFDRRLGQTFLHSDDQMCCILKYEICNFHLSLEVFVTWGNMQTYLINVHNILYHVVKSQV